MCVIVRGAARSAVPSDDFGISLVQVGLLWSILFDSGSFWSGLCSPGSGRVRGWIAVCQAACKPGSVPGGCAPGGGHPSGAAVTRRFTRPTRRRRGTRHRLSIWSCSERGLPSRPVTRPLVRSYRTISPLPQRRQRRPRGGMFLWRYPSGRPAWELPSALSRGARTFLDRARRRSRDRPAAWQIHCTATDAVARRGQPRSRASLASASARRLNSRRTWIGTKTSSSAIRFESCS